MSNVCNAAIANLWSADLCLVVRKQGPTQKKVEKSSVGEIKLRSICFKLNFTCKSAEENEMAGRRRRK